MSKVRNSRKRPAPHPLSVCLFILTTAIWLLHAGYRVKAGIEGIEIFAVQIILCNPKRFPKTGR